MTLKGKTPAPTPKNFQTSTPNPVKTPKIPSNTYRKDGVYFPLTEHKWMKWSRDKHNTQRHNILKFRVMV